MLRTHRQQESGHIIQQQMIEHPMPRLHAQKGDHWQCAVSTPLNELILSLCGSWRHTNRPILSSRATPWPLLARIETRDDSFEFIECRDACRDTLERFCAYILQHGIRSGFRDSTASVKYDDSIRRSTELRADQICSLKDTELRKTALRLMHTLWGLERCSLRLGKIVLYMPGDHFDFHRDVVRDMRHMATLAVTLESADILGGRLVYRDVDNELALAQDYRLHDMMKLNLFYTDTEHKVEPLLRGFKVVVEYEVLKLNEGDKARKSISGYLVEEDQDEDYGLCKLFSANNDEMDEAEPMSPITLRSTNVFEPLQLDEQTADMLVCYLRNVSVTRTPALLMSHVYPVVHVSEETLRGYDKLMWDALQKSFDVEFMPVCISTNEQGKACRCQSLHRHKGAARDLMLFITPVDIVHGTLSIAQALLGGAEISTTSPRYNYCTMAMICNKLNKD